MNHTQLLSRIALTQVPNIGAVQARILVDHFGDADAIFKAGTKELSSIEYIGEVRASAIRHFTNFSEAEAQLRFIEKYNIQPLFLTDPGYPQRLLHCPDAPTLLYFKGNANLNAPKVISIIGTRGNTSYGRHITEKLVADLAAQDVLILSGLAMGIDAIAHKAALTAQLPTVGVLAHGLDTIYPSQHKTLAREMLQQGGLLTEFASNVAPDKYNFPKRNRIVAGMADATIVVETGNKGGSMITAGLASSYNREVFAFPGKTTDAKSAGCLSLIRQNKAALITDAHHLADMMGWHMIAAPVASQVTLFPDAALTAEEQLVVTLCKEKEAVHIDELYNSCGLSSSAVAAVLLQMELKGLLTCLPGKRYALLN
jgi:DNA processing protein